MLEGKDPHQPKSSFFSWFKYLTLTSILISYWCCTDRILAIRRNLALSNGRSAEDSELNCNEFSLTDCAKRVNRKRGRNQSVKATALLTSLRKELKAWKRSRKQDPACNKAPWVLVFSGFLPCVLIFVTLSDRFLDGVFQDIGIKLLHSIPYFFDQGVWYGSSVEQ